MSQFAQIIAVSRKVDEAHLAVYRIVAISTSFPNVRNSVFRMTAVYKTAVRVARLAARVAREVCSKAHYREASRVASLATSVARARVARRNAARLEFAEACVTRAFREYNARLREEADCREYIDRLREDAAEEADCSKRLEYLENLTRETHRCYLRCREHLVRLREVVALPKPE